MRTAEILRSAKDFFDGKFGLEISDDVPGCCLEFANSVGFVSVQVLDEGQEREVILTTREFEYQIQEFLGGLGKAF